MQQLFGMSEKEITKQKDESLKYLELEAFNSKTREKDYECLKNIKLPLYQEKSIPIKSIVKRMTPQPPIDVTADSTMKKIEETVSEFLEEWGEFSDQNKDKLYKRIIEVYGEHSASKRRINSSYVKNNIIPKWIGEKRTEELFNELK